MNSGYLVLFETSGNQAYIYATNKLRENIGASELTYRAGTQWVLEAAGFKNVPTDDPAGFREWLTKQSNTNLVEIILCTSGKSLLLVSDEIEAKKIVAEVTSRAICEAPGLSITGAIVELKGRDKKSVAQAMKEAHERFNTNRDMMPTPAQRFAMLPFCEPCATTGLPAAMFQNNEPLSSVSLKKRGVREGWFKRIGNVFENRNSKLCISSSSDQLENEFGGLSWLGVVFADGNGLGQIMMNFENWLEDGDDYLNTLRAFSVELDTAIEAAFYDACLELEKLGATQKMENGKKRLPLVPLLLGGDDLTVLVDGRFALPFTRAFLEAFEKHTEQQPTIKKIAQTALGAGRLSAGAGIAIVKAHFPFHSAHALAESLLKSAKLAKQKVRQKNKSQPYPCSALDFHILFDAAFASLDDIRKERRTTTVDEVVCQLWGGPYVVTSLINLASAAEEGKEWADRHALGNLRSRAILLSARDDEGRFKLPNTHMHTLREALAQGKKVADARLAEMSWLYERGLKNILENSTGEKDSLFREDNTTLFLDALTSAEFWGINSESGATVHSTTIEEDAA